jgi:hypothetical protein
MDTQAGPACKCPRCGKVHEEAHQLPSGLGATGYFPQGHLSDDDEGELKIAIAYDGLDGIVRVEFGKPVAWLGLPPPEAIEFAKLLLRKAGAKKIEVTF